MFRFHKLKYSSNHAILAKLMDAVSLENLGMLSITRPPFKKTFLTIKSTPTQKCGIFMNFKTHCHDQNFILHLLSTKLKG